MADDRPRYQDHVNELRQRLLSAGYQPIAVRTGGKNPTAFDWPHAVGMPRFHPDASNTGILCGSESGPRGADVDVDDPVAAAEIAVLIETMIGWAPTRTRADSPRFLKAYRCGGAPRPKRVIKLRCGKVEFLGTGTQFLCDGQHPDGATYEWDVPLDEVPIEELRTLSEEQEVALEAALVARWPLSEKPQWEEPTGRPNGAGKGHTHRAFHPDEAADAEDALRHLPNTFDDHDDWLRLGMSAFAAGASFEAFDQWSQQHRSYDPKRTQSAWRSFERNGVRDVTAATLFGLVRERVPTWEKPSRQHREHTHETPGDDEDWTIMASLRSRDFEPLRHVAPPYIVEGVTLLASNPKLGKSWFCMQLGRAVSEGRPVFAGAAPCEQGDVLYLALEDNPRRMQRRALKSYGTGPWPDRMTVRFRTEPAHLGGLESIRAWAKRVAKPRLCMVDVYALFRRPRTAKDDPYQTDFAGVSELRALAAELKIAIVLLHHNRKSGAEVDPFEVVSGTMGLTAGADTVLVLRRESGVIVLCGRGRDVEEEIEAAMRFNRDNAHWEIIGSIDEARQSDERMAILKVLKASASAMTPKDIAAATGKAHNAIRNMLFHMMRDEPPSLRKIGRGLYTLADKKVVGVPDEDSDA